MATTHTPNSGFRYSRGEIGRGTLIGIAIAAVALIVIAVVFMGPEPEQEPVPAPAPAAAPPSRPLETVEPAQSAEARGDTAREIIAALRDSAPEADYQTAYSRAREFESQGRLADAQLLYFFAAQGGYAPAAFSLATWHDPNHHSADNSPMPGPDAFQAYKWYRQARDGGIEGAGERLRKLREWADEAAAGGDTEAERLLLQWE